MPLSLNVIVKRNELIKQEFSSREAHHENGNFSLSSYLWRDNYCLSSFFTSLSCRSLFDF